MIFIAILGILGVITISAIINKEKPKLKYHHVIQNGYIQVNRVIDVKDDGTYSIELCNFEEHDGELSLIDTCKILPVNNATIGD